jgi:hypothetical protein
MLRRAVLLGFAALSLSACGSGREAKGAAESASRLLAAVVSDDRVAFEAEIDRAAVREDVRRQVTELARAASLEVDGGPSVFALDRMISPEALTLVDAASGEALTAAPTPDQVRALMRVVDDTHVCLRDAETPTRCLLTFAKDRDGWRLVGMQAMDLRIEVADVG